MYLFQGWNGARDITTYSSIVAELRTMMTGILYMVRLYPIYSGWRPIYLAPAIVESFLEIWYAPTHL